MNNVLLLLCNMSYNIIIKYTLMYNCIDKSL